MAVEQQALATASSGLSAYNFGGVLGVLLALWSTDLLRSLTKSNLPRLDELSANPAVLAFAAALSLLTGLAAGLVPAFSASRVDLNDSLKVASRTLAGARHNTLRNTLAIAQSSLALLLLTGAGLLIRSFQQLLHVDPGFQSNNLLAMELRLPRLRYDKAVQLAAFETQLLERIRALSGVVSAGVVNSLPIAGFQGATIISIEGRPSPKTFAAGMLVGQRVISPDYFATMHTPFLAGRDFSTRDAQGAPKVAIVNQALATRYFPSENPLGKRIKIDEAGEEWQTIVGIADFGQLHDAGVVDEDIDAPRNRCCPIEHPTHRGRVTYVGLDAQGVAPTLFDIADH